MKHHLVTALLLLIALALYLISYTHESLFFLVTAASCEMLFWVRLLRGPAPKAQQTPRS
jgi:hypothetical protein